MKSAACLVCSLLFFPSFLMAQECHLNEKFVFDQAIVQSDDAKLEEINLKELNNDINDYNVLYDGNFETKASHQIDKSARTNSFFGTRNDVTEFQTKYNQNLEYFSFEAGFRHRREKTDSAFFPINPSHNSTWFGTISVPLIYSVQRTNRTLRDSFQGGIDSADYNYKFAKQQIGYSALQTYRMWIQAQKEIELANETLERAKQYLTTTKKLYNAGLVEKSSYFAAQSNVSSRSEDILATKDYFSTLDLDLKHILRIDQNQSCSYAESSSENNSKALDDYTNTIEQRYDIIAFDKRIDSIEVGIKSYRRGLLPKLEAFTTLEVNEVDNDFGAALGGSASQYNPNWTVGGLLNIPLKNTEIKTKIKRGRINIEKFETRKSKALREIRRDIQNTFQSVDMLSQRIEQLKQTMEFERKKINATKKEYELGRESFLTLLLYEQDFVQIKRGLLNLESEKVIQQYLLELLSGQIGFGSES